MQGDWVILRTSLILIGLGEAINAATLCVASKREA
jgi:hypothetical protein